MKFEGTDRFSVNRELGRGGFGTVYEVHDREWDARVALKLIEKATPDSLYMFKQEFRSIADIVHRNLVVLHELHAADQWFFTMELVDGDDFLAWTRPDPIGDSPATQVAPTRSSATTEPTYLDAPTVRDATDGNAVGSGDVSFQGNWLPPVDEGRLRSALTQLAEGLIGLHNHGMLHRDIKPHNVLVSRADARVVILDFGLVTSLGASESAGTAAGTPAYMSPEQAGALALTTAADWYAVGVMLYQALTGGVPFDGPTTSLLVRKIRNEAPRPSVLVPTVPAYLDDLCARLLDRNPQTRADGNDILRALGGQRSISLAWSAEQLPLIGREQETSRLQAAFTAAREGAQSVTFVSGRSGHGKTALVSHFLKEAEQSATVLRARCHERETMPFKAVDGIVDALTQYLAGLEPAKRRDLLPEGAEVLTTVFPVLAKVFDRGATFESRDLGQDARVIRNLAFAALREILFRVAEREPLILFIDDLQWGDVDSAPLLVELMRPPNPPPFLLLATYRKEEEETSRFLRALYEQAARVGVSPREVFVGPLEDAAVTELVHALAGPVVDIVSNASLIADESQGSPLFVHGLVQYLLDGAISASALRISFDDMLRARIDKLEGQARSLLEMVAVAARPIAVEFAFRAAGLDAPDRRVAAMLRSQWLVKTSGRGEERIEPYHDRIREVVASDMPSARWKSLNLAMARALESEGAEPEALIKHYQDAGEQTRAAELAVAAAARAERAFAFDRASSLLRLALDAQSDETKRQGLLVNLGQMLSNAGRIAEAADVILQAAATAKDLDEAFNLRLRGGELYMICGRIEKGMAVLEKVVPEAGLSWPSSTVGAIASFVRWRAEMVARGFRFTPRSVDEIDPKLLRQADTAASAARSLGPTAVIRTMDMQTRGVVLALRAGEPRRIARAISAEMVVSAVFGSKKAPHVAKLLKKAQDIERTVDDADVRLFITVHHNQSQYLLAQFKASYEAVANDTELLDPTTGGRASLESINARFHLLLACIELGRIGECDRRVWSWLKEAGERGDLATECLLRAAVTPMVYLAKNLPERARTEARLSADMWVTTHADLLAHLQTCSELAVSLYLRERELVSSVVDAEKRFSGADIMRVEALLVQHLDIIGRCVIGAGLVDWDVKDCIHRATRIARRLDKLAVVSARASAATLRAGIAALDGQTDKLDGLLASAEEIMIEGDLGLRATSAAYWRAALAGNPDGVSAASQKMVDAGVVSPSRFASMYFPGFVA